MDVASVQNFLQTTVAELAVKVGAAILFWIVGRWLIGRVIALMQAAMNRNNVDSTLTKYLGSVVAVALNIALVLGILGYFGIQTTSFAAMLGRCPASPSGRPGAACWATSPLAPSCWFCGRSRWGTSSPSAAVTGTVHELGLFGTTLITPDNVMTLVGNGKVFGDTVQNYCRVAGEARRTARRSWPAASTRWRRSRACARPSRPSRTSPPARRPRSTCWT
jgi:small conductance mechanosensitive channel